MIRRYWDMTVDERAALTVEEVEALTKVELMEAGVLVPRPPELLPAEPPPTERRTLVQPSVGNTRYGTQKVGIAFEDVEDLRAFLALRPIFVDDEWPLGVKTAIPITGDEEHSTVEVVSKQEVERLRSALERAQQNKAANEEETRRYAEECRASQKALEGMWADYQQARTRALRLQRIRETHAEYLAMTGGDDGVARAFLARTKGFDPADVEAAIGPSTESLAVPLAGGNP